eukprot:13112-Heterococcus_DN1.PRE.8
MAASTTDWQLTTDSECSPLHCLYSIDLVTVNKEQTHPVTIAASAISTGTSSCCCCGTLKRYSQGHGAQLQMHTPTKSALCSTSTLTAHIAIMLKRTTVLLPQFSVRVQGIDSGHNNALKHVSTSRRLERDVHDCSRVLRAAISRCDTVERNTKMCVNHTCTRSANE